MRDRHKVVQKLGAGRRLSWPLRNPDKRQQWMQSTRDVEMEVV